MKLYSSIFRVRKLDVRTVVMSLGYPLKECSAHIAEKCAGNDDEKIPRAATGSKETLLSVASVAAAYVFAVVYPVIRLWIRPTAVLAGALLCAWRLAPVSGNFNNNSNKKLLAATMRFAVVGWHGYGKRFRHSFYSSSITTLV